MLSVKQAQSNPTEPSLMQGTRDASWTCVKDTNHCWTVDSTDYANGATPSQKARTQVAKILGQLNTDQLSQGANGITVFDDDSGQTYHVKRLSEGRVSLSQTSTATYLQQYLAEREALFFTSQTISVGEMATTLAHEMNQPVGAIQNLLQGIEVRLRRDNTNIEDIRNAVQRAMEQTQYAARIITRIRDFTQARQPNFSVLPVHKLLEDSARLLDWVFSQRDITLQYNVNQSLTVRGDYTMLQQVVTNLLRNASEAIETVSDHAGVISLSAELREDKVLIQIKDNGSGLQNPQELFTPFATSKPDGMGVGLNICRSFIELHNGRLWLTANETKAPETAGCTANIQLPYLGEHYAK